MPVLYIYNSAASAFCHIPTSLLHHVWKDNSPDRSSITLGNLTKICHNLQFSDVPDAKAAARNKPILFPAASEAAVCIDLDSPHRLSASA